MTILPQEIQNDFSLFALNEELKRLRAEFGQAVSKMESGSYSIKKSFSGLIDNINNLIDSLTSAVEVAIIPSEVFADFEAGLVTLDEYGGFDIIKYYNGLKKLKFAYYGVVVALNQLQDVPVKPITPAMTQESGVLDSLDTKEFIEQGAENPVFEAQQSYKYYTIVQGDTLSVIASKVYSGDMNRWPEIAQANQITDSDLLDNNMVGLTIKIPVDAVANSNILNNNLVYEKFFDGLLQSAIDRYNYGRDIYLFRGDGYRGKFEISSIGDLKKIEGNNCLVYNLQSRFFNFKGALNPLNPTWGLERPMGLGNVPYAIALDRMLTDMESQCTDDPRVVSASINRKEIKIEGDVIRVSIDINTIGGKNLETNFDVRNIP